MTSIIENEILEALIVAYEQKLNSIRQRHLGPGKAEIIKTMETVLAKAKAAMPAGSEIGDCDHPVEGTIFETAQ